MNQSTDTHEAPDLEVEAVLQIIGTIFKNDSRVWDRVDIARRNMDFVGMIDHGGFSTHERILLEAAASIWGGAGGNGSPFGQIAWGMDDDFLAALLNALRVARGKDLPVRPE